MIYFLKPFFKRLLGDKLENSHAPVHVISPERAHHEMLAWLARDLEAYDHVHVTFRTKAGHIRTMDCSRKASMPSGRDDAKLNNEQIIAVYDHQNSAWRSFRKDSVQSYEVKV